MEQSKKQSQRFLDTLLTMDRIGSEKELREVAAQQHSFEAVEQVITETLVSIGDGWEALFHQADQRMYTQKAEKKSKNP